MNFRTCRAFVWKLCDASCSADIKPDNFVLAHAWNPGHKHPPVVKMVDFGPACWASPSTRLTTKRRATAFMSPNARRQRLRSPNRYVVYGRALLPHVVWACSIFCYTQRRPGKDESASSNLAPSSVVVGCHSHSNSCCRSLCACSMFLVNPSTPFALEPFFKWVFFYFPALKPKH